ncbi:P2X purinoceptor 7 [Bombina bombina]|uniref:P2X purinoceptor 7 n=1 Tax=Bombina bombina TaxID=8345 RepID=UPI00235AB6FA|nr:P2X purinoceptor 7 [Bombina bombina]
MSCADICEYTTNKEVRIRSVPLGILKFMIFFSVLLYMCYILITEKRYQKKDSVISSVHTKVKGVLDVDSRIWDTAEYTFPSPGGDSFFVLTNYIKTEDQVEGVCPEFPSPKTICSRDDICKKGHAAPQSNGIQTGRCVQFNSQYKTCEISAWCPVESKSTPVPAVLGSAENFTVLIKNNIHFAAFNFTTKNILPKYNMSCIYDRITAPQCPIFRLGDILKEAGENFSQVAIQGGIMGIEINWRCDLDLSSDKCIPQYSFRRLDDKVIDERLYPGLNFRYYKMKGNSEKEQRILIKAYGIRFDIQVYGTGGKFNWYELILFIGSYLSYFYEKACGPCIIKPLRYVSFVDQDNFIMVDTNLTKSLQKTEGECVQKENTLGFSKATLHSQCSIQTEMAVNESEIHLLNIKKKPSPSSRPQWCKCLKCLGRKKFEDQLCCRLNNGECITNSDLFKKMVLSTDNLIYILQYNNPLLNKHDISKEDLVQCAEKQYIRWRFGSNKDVLGFATIPSCCKNAITENMEKHDGS